MFGYSIVFDVSTRDNGEEEEEEEEDGGGFNFGVNWFEAKSRDNAAPFGPVIVPKEFIGDAANLPHGDQDQRCRETRTATPRT